MRKMKNTSTGVTVNVTEFFMTRNMWEYFITDNKFNDDIVTAVVAGFETEMGDVSLAEIKPYITLRGTPQDAMPAPGWEWV